MMKNMQWFVHKIIEAYVHDEVHAIDMTMGQGYDTVHLASRAKHVSAFDVQEAALHATALRLEREQRHNVTLYHASHEQFAAYVQEPYHFVIFNCGYLPGSDKRIKTHPTTTTQALNAAYEGLSPEGVIVMTLYAKHEGAAQETQAVHAALKAFKDARISRYHFLFDGHAPEVILIEKKP